MPTQHQTSPAVSSPARLLKGWLRAFTPMKLQISSSCSRFFLSLYQRFADSPPNLAEAVAEAPRRERVRLNDDNDNGEGASQTKRSGLTQPKFEQIARELLLTRGRPAQRSALLHLFRESGFTVGGADELKNLGTKIWMARAVLTNIRGEGYWPIDVPCPAVGYIPPQQASDKGQLAPSLPRAIAAEFFPSLGGSGIRSSTWPVAISPISFASWIGSRGRLRRCVAMLVIWHSERRSETQHQEPSP
jgi:hypothetical protein